MSTGPATGGVVGGVTTVATNLTSVDGFAKTDLQSLYACNNVTVGGITYNPNTAGAGQQQVDLYIPQAGSGTRNFWAGQMGINATTPPACVHDTIVAGTLTGTIVEEHDGKAVATDPNGFGPFSISQWIGQRNGHNDRRHGAVLHNIGGVSPFANGQPTGSLNTAFPITREVFNVVQFSRISGGTAEPGLVALIVGTGSGLCQDSLQIRSYGFGTLSATTPDTCGAVTTAHRAFAAG
jgi:phosphate transport system substrate-binding protein